MFDLERQKRRSELYSKIRRFFDEKKYYEIFTPSLSTNLIPESTIENFKTSFINEFKGNKDLFLIPSPEVFMKRVIAETKESVYQISTCFRNSEQLGHIHNPEFTMLEYYTVNFNEQDSISLTEDLINEIKFKNSPSYALPPFTKLSVKEAVKEFTNLDLDKNQEDETFRENLYSLGLSPAKDESWDDMFNRLLIQFIEPNLPFDKPVALLDYPKQINCLAELNGNYRRRWELYINRVEVANCYKEETNKQITKEYYQKEYTKLVEQRNRTNMPIPAISESFTSIDLPSSSGVAIGLDRLLMCLLGKKDLSSLLLFPFDKF